jgi:hypothetical protein
MDQCINYYINRPDLDPDFLEFIKIAKRARETMPIDIRVKIVDLAASNGALKDEGLEIFELLLLHGEAPLKYIKAD